MYVVKDNLHWRFVGVNYNLCFFFFFLWSDSQFITILFCLTISWKQFEILQLLVYIYINSGHNPRETMWKK
jgi:hypothetical protein